MNSLGVDAEEIVKRHIKLLHRYNETKDATQILIGRVSIDDFAGWHRPTC